MKELSYQKCFIKAFTLMVKNIYTFTKALYIPALGIGLIMAVCNMIHNTASIEAKTVCIIIATIADLYLLNVMIVTIKKMFDSYYISEPHYLPTLSTIKNIKWSLNKSLTPFSLFFTYLAIICIICFATWLIIHKSLWWGFLLTPIIYLIVPQTISIFSCITDDLTYLKALKKGWKDSNKQFGKVWMLQFVCGIIFIAFALLASLPLIILNIYFNISANEILMGDEVIIPTYVHILLFILTVILTALISIFTTYWTLANLYLIKSQEDEMASKS